MIYITYQIFQSLAVKVLSPAFLPTGIAEAAPPPRGACVASLGVAGLTDLFLKNKSSVFENL